MRCRLRTPSHASSAILWKLDALQAWDRDFSAASKLITIEEPAFMTNQPRLEGITPHRIGPAPEDFESENQMKPPPAPNVRDNTPGERMSTSLGRPHCIERRLAEGRGPVEKNAGAQEGSQEVHLNFTFRSPLKESGRRKVKGLPSVHP